MWPFKKKITILDDTGRSDLHYAACDGDLAAVQKLVSRGADVNLQDKHGWTPLHFAAQALSVIREANLDPFRVNVNGGARAL